MHWLLVILTMLVSSEGQSTQAPGSQPGNTDAIVCGDVPQSCCDNKYRTYDGTCNNLNHSWWGASFQPYKRTLPACYSDGVHAFPISETNASLPNPRKCSLRTFVDLDDPDDILTLLLMQYGQVVTHDMGQTADVPPASSYLSYYNDLTSVRVDCYEIYGERIACCVDGKINLKELANPRCAPIDLPKDDPYNAPEGRKCINFVRTLTTSDLNCTCTSKVAEPVNAVTSYIDVSIMYGSQKKTADLVRELKGGRLKYVVRNKTVLLPQHPEPLLACNVDVATEPCYVTGDVRVNQSPHLSIVQNILLAQHNNIAKALDKINYHWDDERLFQETRKIMIGKHQHIIFNEYLPVILGTKHMIDNKLLYPGAVCPIDDYDPNVNAATSNEFAIAFRRFHTQIRGHLRAYKENRKENDCHDIRLHEWFAKPSICEQGDNFNDLSRGLVTQPGSAVNRYHTNDISNLLFAGRNLLGGDLNAIDIHRGRDHGTASYVKVLSYYNIAIINTFIDLEQLMEKKYVNILEDLYASPKDIDLILGISLEKLIPGSLSGPTIRAILTDQFWRARVGDRYFYENKEKYAFTPDQLAEIRKSTIAEFMCNNPGIKKIQCEAFKLVSPENPLKLCDYTFNAKPWKENIKLKFL